jgi:PPK2 family polyphosphate:nucleotide phosphotransferase
MSLNTEEFLVKEDKTVKLNKWPTQIKPLYENDEHYEQMLKESKTKLSEMQNKLYAHDRFSLLLIFQAMDAAGKDSAIKHVMSGVNPQGCQVFSFKHPSPEELDHDFLWRTTRNLPERGRIGIFNRSYYEEVLVVKVHPEILSAQKLPNSIDIDKKFWKNRYQSINDFENHLFRNGTHIIKFFLHVSKDEQKRRFLKRIEEVDKNWKFSVADMKERDFWDDYMEAYENCLSQTSKDDSPWYIVPADNKNNARLIISKVIVEKLNSLGLSYPKIDAQQRREILEIKKQLSGNS